MGAGIVIPMKGQDFSPSYFLLHGPHADCFHLIISTVPRANLDPSFISTLWMPLQIDRTMPMGSGVEMRPSDVDIAQSQEQKPDGLWDDCFCKRT